MDNIMEFVRGDGAYHTFSIPASSWTSGGHLFFAAKSIVDDDNTDSNAKIQGDWGDDKVSDVTIDGVAYKQYDCYFPPSATNSIDSGGAAFTDYLGEFQFVPATNIPVTFPATNDKIVTRLYFDIKRKTSV